MKLATECKVDQKLKVKQHQINLEQRVILTLNDNSCDLNIF